MKNGKKEDELTYYKENGKIDKKETYKNDKKDGKEIVYYESG